MNVASTQNEGQKVNVLPFLEGADFADDPLQQLTLESVTGAELESEMELFPTMRSVVSEDQFPDQSMYVLDKQLKHLKESLDRIKFYLGDLDDLLPR